jgi:hypothetical protein
MKNSIPFARREFLQALGGTSMLPNTAVANTAYTSGSSGSIFATEAQFNAASVPTALNLVEIASYSGDGLGRHLKERIPTPSTPEPWQSQSADGAWFQIMRKGYFDAADLGIKSDDPTLDNAWGIHQSMRAARAFGLREVVLPPGRIFCRSSLIPIPGIKLIGRGHSAILDFSALATDDPLLRGGGSFEATRRMTGSTAKGRDIVPIAGHGYLKGDWIRLDSTISANMPEAGDDRLGDRDDILMLAESQQIREVVNENSVRLTRPLRYNYPIGSTSRKINPLSRFAMTEVVIDQAGGGQSLGILTLVHDLQWNWVRFDNVRGPLRIRNSIGDSFISDSRFEGDRSIDVFSGGPGGAHSNLQHLKVVDGCMFFKAQRNRHEWGGQCVDVTYTPSSAEFRAPCIGTDISGGQAYDTSFSAFTDHPGVDGTIANDLYGEGVAGLVLIRSRRSQAFRHTAYGRGTGIGYWFGENGYFHGAQGGDCKMYNFDIGYSISGRGDTIGRRDVNFSNMQAESCRIGANFGPTTIHGDDCGTSFTDFKCANIGETAITVHGSNAGINLEGISLRGPVSAAGIDITGVGLRNAVLKGEVIDLGSDVPVIQNFTNDNAGNNVTDIVRRGSNGMNKNLDRAVVVVASRRLYSSTYSTISVDPLGMDIRLLPAFWAMPVGILDKTAKIVVEVSGAVTASKGNKSLLLKLGSETIGLAVIPAAAESYYRVVFELVGETDITRSTIFQVRSTLMGSAITTVIKAGSQIFDLRSVAGILSLFGQCARGGGMTVDRVDVYGEWA